MAIVGSQGSVVYRTRNGMDVAIKSSKYNKLCLELEAKVLQQISNECPEVADHFPKFVEMRDGKLIMSRIVCGEDFSEFGDRLLESNCRSLRRKAHNIIRNLCCITLCVLEQVRRKTGIVHNDLHTSNVMIVKTEKESLSFNFEKPYTFATFGFFPIIIDFGYAHIEGCVMGSLQNSDIGYVLEEQDLLADARLLLSTAKCNRQLIRDIFGPLKLTGDGWFPKHKFAFTNVYDELHAIACKKTSRQMDAALTVVVSKMGNLTEITPVTPCGPLCYFTSPVEIVVFSDDEEETDEEGAAAPLKKRRSESKPTKEMCDCCKTLKTAFLNLYAVVNDKKNNDEKVYEKAAVVFKPFVTRSLAHNRAIKRKAYEQLVVENTLDVIDLIIG